jgi:hypothetical protein
MCFLELSALFAELIEPAGSGGSQGYGRSAGGDASRL